MAGELIANIPAADVKALSDRIHRIHRAFPNRTLEDAMRWGIYYAATSMGASMRKAPKRRRTLKNRGDNPDFPQDRFPRRARVWSRAGRRRRSMQWHYVKAGEEKTDPRLIIRRAGLARDSWKWGVSKTRRGTRGRMKHRPIAGVVRTEFSPSRGVIENRLRYIHKAARTTGKRAVSTAYSRAARGIDHYFERRLRRQRAI